MSEKRWGIRYVTLCGSVAEVWINESQYDLLIKWENRLIERGLPWCHLN